MMGKTKIEWCDYSINPLRVRGGKVWKHGYHCEKSSPGCVRCYAEALNMRYGTGLPYTKRDVDFYLDLSVFDTLPKKKPARVFVQDMSDLFLPGVPFEMIGQIYDKVVQLSMSRGHTFLWLTKHINRMLHFYKWQSNDSWYEQHIHLGVTVCNQKEADEKIPILLQIPAAKRFVSFEPLLGPIDLFDSMFAAEIMADTEDWPIDWGVIGCESGPKRRPCKIEWMETIVKQLRMNRIPCFVKQVNINGRVSHNPDEWPASLRVREIGDSQC